MQCQCMKIQKVIKMQKLNITNQLKYKCTKEIFKKKEKYYNIIQWEAIKICLYA